MEYIVCDRLAHCFRYHGHEEPQGAGLDAGIGRYFSGMGSILPTMRISGNIDRKFTGSPASAHCLCHKKSGLRGWHCAVLSGRGVGRREEPVTVRAEFIPDFTLCIDFACAAQGEEEHWPAVSAISGGSMAFGLVSIDKTAYMEV